MSSSNSTDQLPLDHRRMAADSHHPILLKDDQPTKRKLEIRLQQSDPSDSSLDIQHHRSSPTSHQQTQDHDSNDQDSRLLLLQDVAEDFPRHEIEKATDTTSLSSSSSASAEEPNADGFRTPTGSGHKIPAATTCPPAPRKPKPWPEQRRLKSTGVRRSLEAEFCGRELEAMFPMKVEFCDPKLKRRRRD